MLWRARNEYVGWSVLSAVFAGDGDWMPRQDARQSHENAEALGELRIACGADFEGGFKRSVGREVPDERSRRREGLNTNKVGVHRGELQTSNVDGSDLHRTDRGEALMERAVVSNAKEYAFIFDKGGHVRSFRNGLGSQ